MKKTFKAALIAALGLAGITTVQAATYNGDALVGFTTASGNDLVYDLGSPTTFTNGQSWSLGAALSSASLSNSLASVNWGVVATYNTGSIAAKLAYSDQTQATGTPNNFNGSPAWGAINTQVGTLVNNDFSAVGAGNFVVVDHSLTYSWNSVVGNVGNQLSPYTGTASYPGTVGTVSIPFYSTRDNNSSPVLLGNFALSSTGVLTFTTPSTSVSSNAYLTSLVLSPAGLTSTFVSNTFSYYATNAYGNTPTVTVVNADTTATNQLIYNSTTNLLTSGSPSAGLALTLGSTNVAQVQVTAQDGVTVQTYTVNIVEQPSLTAPKLTNSVSGSNLALSWAADHLGYRLLVQTNNLSKGVSGNSSDWGTVTGSTSVTSTNIAIIKTGVTNEYYRLVYP